MFPSNHKIPFSETLHVMGKEAISREGKANARRKVSLRGKILPMREYLDMFPWEDIFQDFCVSLPVFSLPENPRQNPHTKVCQKIRTKNLCKTSAPKNRTQNSARCCDSKRFPHDLSWLET